MYELQEFLFMGKRLRVVVVDGEIFYFVASDVCQMLGLNFYSTARTVQRAVPDSECVKLFKLLDRDGKTIKQACMIQNHTGLAFDKLNYKAYLVTETGLYRLIMRSNKPDAKNFQNWVFGDVLPTLRKNGTYTIPGIENTPLLTNELQGVYTTPQPEQRNIHFEISVNTENGTSLHISKVIPADTDPQKLSTILANTIEAVKNIL